MTALQRTMATSVLLFLILAPLTALAQPIAVTLYPNSGVVTELATVQLTAEAGLNKATLTLPAATDPASLRISPEGSSGLTPTDVSVLSVERRDEGRIKMVHGQLSQAKAKRQELVDKRSAHEGAAAYWRSISGKEGPKASDAAGMAAAVRQGLVVELAAASALSREIKSQAKTIKELEEELKRLTGGSVRILVATVTLTGKAAKQAKLRWSYRLNTAGWTPRYTLNAKPDTGVVDFTWDAELWQNSGTTWNDVAVTLATAEFRGGHAPGALPPWQIRPDAPMLRKTKEMFSDNAMEEPLALMAAGAPASAPVRSEGRIFDSYDAGRTSLDSGSRKRILMEQTSWKAKFDYLVRPAVGPGAYTHAAFTFDSAPKYPNGPATYLLDSAMVRKASFALYTKQSELFFGTDPQLEVRRIPLARQSGEAGFLSSKKSHSWDWRVSINNTKSIPVSMRIEERIPQIGDERIELEKRLPDADEEAGGLAIWSLKLNPGQKTDLEYGYSITYPKDMILDLGGR
ncbi:DUF4139 domain-containing protein [Desulfovibrio ferrophilus]|uniref:DUF4139 domain-containing protein n=1 Tax=Desulfovibrio ferrophilus TaxID=241368 RepID=A0A2Z6B3L8_9BACT|nr:DUF4139 domain-containing protein [Desulfovibrio ferrophilus]BBD10028.1 uncharacterized protein DFE_3302 [Desulfovibrio ferrophilus]